MQLRALTEALVYVRQRAAEIGFDYHIVKPIDLDWLRTLLDDCARDKPTA